MPLLYSQQRDSPVARGGRNGPENLPILPLLSSFRQTYDVHISVDLSGRHISVVIAVGAIPTPVTIKDAAIL